jgi:hypothetical protein
VSCMRDIPCQAASRRGVRLTRQFCPAPGWRTMGAHLHLWWAWAYSRSRPGVSSLSPRPPGRCRSLLGKLPVRSGAQRHPNVARFV